MAYSKPQKVDTTQSVRLALNKPAVLKRFEEILGRNPSGFVSSVTQATSSNSLLKTASAESIMNAAVNAAVLNLSINPSIGHAYIVPYKGEAALQIGYKGMIQLAIRSGLFKTIDVCRVYADDTNEDVLCRLDSLIPDDREDEEAVAYCARFELTNGYTGKEVMSVKKIREHAEKFSQTYQSELKKKAKGEYATDSVWTSNFEAMAMKTVLKRLLSRKAPLSIDMQNAISVDENPHAKLDDSNIIEHESFQEVEAVEATKITPDNDEFERIIENISSGELEYNAVFEMYSFTEEQLARLEKL